MDRPVVTGGRLLRPRWIATGVVALLALGALALPAVRDWSRADRAIDASSLRTAPVLRGDLQRDVWVQGRVVAALHPSLFSPAQGIVSLRVKPGTQVRRGETLALIESGELRSRLAQAEAELSSARSEYERQKIVSRQRSLRATQQIELLVVRVEAANRALDRARRAFGEGIGNRSELEAAQDSERIATIELEQAVKDATLESETAAFELRTRGELVRREEAAATELRARTAELTVAAPFDGMIAAVAVADSDAVAPNQPILTIVNLSTYELEIAIPEEYARETRIDLPCAIRYGERDLEGRVTAVSPEVANGQVTGTVVFAGEPPRGLKQSERVTVRLLFESKRDVLKVARGAFADSGSGGNVWVVDGTLARRRPVSLGVTSATEVEVLRGLREGERVITSDTTAFQSAETVLLR